MNSVIELIYSIICLQSTDLGVTSQIEIFIFGGIRLCC